MIVADPRLARLRFIVTTATGDPPAKISLHRASQILEELAGTGELTITDVAWLIEQVKPGITDTCPKCGLSHPWACVECGETLR